MSSVAWVLGARVRVSGGDVGNHTLVVANHTSWLDIVLLGGSLGSAFVSKDNLGHGLIHWLADQNGTIYVRRSHVKGARDQAIALAHALGGGKPVTIFPEGTTGPGTYLLPFRSALLEAVNLGTREITVRPVAIDYGGARAEVGWFNEEPGMANVLRIIGRRGTLPVTIHVLPPLEPGLDRKQLAHEAREQIARTLGLTSHPHSPIGDRK